MVKIAVAGSSNTDMVVQIPRLPVPGETVLGGEFLLAAGGKGANQAVAAARLGAQVTLISCIGQDIFGDQALAGFQQEGIVTQYVSTDPDAPSGVALILVDAAGENSIAVAPGANTRLSADHVRRASEPITTADVLLLQLEIPLGTVIAAAEIAHRAGVRVILNPAPAPPDPLPAELLACVDVLTPNENEARHLAGVGEDFRVAALHLSQSGVDTVVVTLGAQGAWIASPDGGQRVPGFTVDAVDTTAAGDAFNGGLAVALAEGKPLVEAVRFANCCGALATTQLGAQPSLPTAKAVRSVLEQQ